ncbi:NAD-dependent epimerase/dehydratase family protein [Patescibacteria group bacterium]
MSKNIKNRIVITGGSGFIGTSLLMALKNNGIENIIVIDRHKPIINPSKTVLGDFGNARLLKNSLQEDDIVIHLACSTIPTTSESDKARDVNENIIKTLRLLEICEQKKINKFIFISSGGTVYGHHGKKKLKETDQTNPINAHGIMKLAIEKYILLFNHIYGLNYLILRPSNPYGWQIDRQKQQGIIDVFLRKAINNEILEVWGNGKIVRDYIYIDDLINFIITALEAPITNKIFNVGTGMGADINSLLQIISEITGKKLNVHYMVKRNFDVPYNVLNIEKAYELINWKPEITIEKGITQVYKNMVK